MRAIALVAIALGVLVAAATYALAAAQEDATPPAEPIAEEPVQDPLGPNAACYVCHMTFVREELVRTHLKAEVTCIACHGLSDKHANDEDIGATKPDVVLTREAVNDSCRACHPTHDVAPEAVIARWLERGLTESPPVCTDCHGSHRIERPAPEPEPEPAPDEEPAAPEGE